ncbi:MAG: DUF262 domain-containing protein [Anaerolineae bacterium]|nr:DUF262 domain-containing protein [Anaerolineae bacterium]
MAKWESLAVEKVVQGIREDKLVLPVIQRSLVWNEEKMELLFDSLLKDNSFGGIMVLDEEKGERPLFAFRRFSREGEEQHSVVQEKLDQSISLVIDGQQRLQAFYMGLEGANLGKTMYFNLCGTPLEYEFRFAHDESKLPQQEPDDGKGTAKKLWYPVRTLFSRLRKVGDDIQVANEIIAARGVTGDVAKDAVKANVARFYRYVSHRDTIGISSVTVNKTHESEERQRIVELFRRLNDGGTRLSLFDLAASMFKGFDYRMERFFREVRQFDDIGIGQDEVIKLIFLLQGNHIKEVTGIEASDAEFVIQNRERIIVSLQVLCAFLEHAELTKYYQSGGRSVIPLYFVAYHIFHKDVPTAQLGSIYDNFDVKNDDFLSLKRWVYLSVLNGVFSRGVGWIPYRTGIRKILDTLKGYKNQVFPAEALFEVYRQHPLAFSSEIAPGQIDRWDRDFAFYLMYDCKVLAGRDIDHVHPKSKLDAAGVAPHQIHSLANLQLLDEGTNRGEKRAKSLAEWLNSSGVGKQAKYLCRHLIPEEEAKWEIAQFDAFLQERAAKIVEKVCSAIPDPVFVPPPPSPVVSETPPAEAVAAQPLPAIDVDLLREQLTPEQQADPVLQDNTTWHQIYIEAHCGPQWAGIYRKALASIGVKTVADLALLVMALELEVWWKGSNDSNIYRFHDPAPGGDKVAMDTRSFGRWAWSVALQRFEQKGFDWREFLVDAQPRVQVDKDALHDLLPQEYWDHPILQDQTTWADVYKNKGLYGPWAGRYRNQLGSVGIVTIADFALYIMALQLEFLYSYEWGNVFRFHRPAPDGQEITLNTKSFGGWAWSTALNELKARGLDWEACVVNQG